MLHVFLADGFEEIEAFTTIDILRRCGLEVQTVSITSKRLIHGAHNIPIMVDTLFRHSTMANSRGFILPGGMPGTKNLMAFDGLRKAIVAHNNKKRLIAAICAAPMLLGEARLLIDRRVTCYPGFENSLHDAIIVQEPVVEDNNMITGRGPGAATEFAFAIAARFVSPDVIMKVKSDMLIA